MLVVFPIVLHVRNSGSGSGRKLLLCVTRKWQKSVGHVTLSAIHYHIIMRRTAPLSSITLRLLATLIRSISPREREDDTNALIKL